MNFTFSSMFFVHFVIFLSSRVSLINCVVVQLPNGKIRGKVFESATNVSYVGFLDVPYGAPPIGALRFKPPVPVGNWKGVLDTTENRKICYQFGGNPVMVNSTMENEDCLYLNVYTPSDLLTRCGSKNLKHKMATCHNSRPILVYIYGGGLIYGNATHESYGPDFWIDNNLVVVTLNYRMGPLGFLSTQDNIISGNMGLKDQNLALKWIQDNIQNFGGDPNKVTISGQSAGAVSVGYHLLSKKSKGLFSKAIFQSGTPLCSWSYQKNPRDIALRYASVLDTNFNSSATSSELLKFLSGITAYEMKYTSFKPNIGYQMGVASPWVAVTENPDNDESFFTGHVYSCLAKGDFTKVPVLMGFMSEESINEAADLASFKLVMTQYDNNISLAVNQDFNINSTDLIKAGTELRKIYTDGRFQDNLGRGIAFNSDARMTTPSIEHAVLQSKFTEVYLFQFSYAGALGDNNYQIDGAERVQHTAELNYMWRRPRNSNLSLFPEEDILTQKKLLKLWTNFISFGNPTPNKNILLNNVNWPKISAENLLYLNINETLQVQVNPKQYRKWKTVVDKYGNPPFDTY